MHKKKMYTAFHTDHFCNHIPYLTSQTEISSFLSNSPLCAAALPDLPLQAKAMHSYRKGGDENNLICFKGLLKE